VNVKARDIVIIRCSGMVYFGVVPFRERENLPTHIFFWYSTGKKKKNNNKYIKEDVE
jgi:hypothetical protein